MRKVVLICPSFRFSQIEFKKPPYYIIKTIGDIYKLETEIVYDDVFYPYFYQERDSLEIDEYNGTKINCIAKANKSKNEAFRSYKKYLKENAKDIKVLICFHGEKRGIILCNYYKKYNKNGKVLIVLDYSSGFYRNLGLLVRIKTTIKKFIFFFRLKSFVNNVDYFSVQTKEGVDFFNQRGWNGFNIKDKLIYLPYGYDEKKYTTEKLNKEKIIITVGRIGTYQKNSEMILDALIKVDLGKWKFIFVGPIEENFKSHIEDFYLNCPKNKNKVEFIGSVDDAERLADYYNKATVFVLSSRFESFALVLVEAAAKNCFLLSTRVGCAEDIIKEGFNGFFFNDEAGLITLLKRIVSNDISFDNAQDVNLFVKDNYSWSTIIDNSLSIKKLMVE